MQSIPSPQVPATLPKFQVIALDAATHDVLGAATVHAKNTYRAKRRAEITLILDGKISHRSPYVLRSKQISKQITEGK